MSTDGNIITVDSTIGWPEKNGTIIIDDSEVVQYKEKSLNQFIECTRSKNGVVEDWDPGTTIHSDILSGLTKDRAMKLNFVFSVLQKQVLPFLKTLVLTIYQAVS